MGNWPKPGFTFYPDVDTKTLYLLAIGDKNTQHEDVQFCKECVTELRKTKLVDKDASQEQTNESPEPPPRKGDASKAV
jgi:hypothetical protein